MEIGESRLVILILVMLLFAEARHLHSFGDPLPDPSETEESGPLSHDPDHRLRQDHLAAANPRLSAPHGRRRLEPERRYVEQRRHAARVRIEADQSSDHARAGQGRLEAAPQFAAGSWRRNHRQDRLNLPPGMEVTPYTIVRAGSQTWNSPFFESSFPAFTTDPSTHAQSEAEDQLGIITTPSPTTVFPSAFATQAPPEAEAEAENDPPVGSEEEEEKKQERSAKRILTAVAASLSALFFFLALACCFCPRRARGKVSHVDEWNRRRCCCCYWGRGRKDFGKGKKRRRWRKDRRQVVNVIYRRPLQDAFGLSASCSSLQTIHPLKAKCKDNILANRSGFTAGWSRSSVMAIERKLLHVLDGSDCTADVTPAVVAPSTPLAAEDHETAPSICSRLTLA